MNSKTISIDTLYNQLTAILQEEMYAKSTIQLYQEHVKRIKRYMSANDLIYYLLFLQGCRPILQGGG